MNPTSRTFTSHVHQIQYAIAEYEDKVGLLHPSFLIDTYSNVISNCYASHSLALLYLHAPEHQDTISFYQQIMSTVPFKALLDDTQWTLWMADITTPQGYSVQTQLGIATLPSLVLVQCVSARSLRVLYKSSDVYTDIIPDLRKAIHFAEPIMAEANARQQQLDASAILRAEQDMAYEDALQDDRERLAAIEHAKTVEQEALRISELEIKQYEMDLLKKKEWCDTNHASVGFPTANIFNYPMVKNYNEPFRVKILCR